jgi:hypothetical protein
MALAGLLIRQCMNLHYPNRLGMMNTILTIQLLYRLWLKLMDDPIIEDYIRNVRP